MSPLSTLLFRTRTIQNCTYLILLSAVIDLTSAARILFVSAPCLRSHQMSMLPFANHLKARGHHVALHTEHVKNYPITPGNDIENISPGFHLNKYRAEVLRRVTHDSRPLHAVHRALDSIYVVLFSNKVSHEAVKMDNPDETDALMNTTWDFVFIDTMRARTGFEFAKRSTNFGYLHVAVVTHFDVEQCCLPVTPAATLPAYLQHDRLEFMPIYFWDRFSSAAQYWALKYLTPIMINHYYGDHDYTNAALQLSIVPLPTVSPITPEWHAVDYRKPVDKTMTLPENIRQFIEDPSSNGTIVVTFGTLMNFENGNKLFNTLFESFTQLQEYRIVFLQDEKQERLPNNTLAIAWLDELPLLLKHKKTQLIVFHGGLKTYADALDSEIPSVVVPIVGETLSIAVRLTQLGIARSLNRIDLKPLQVVQTIREVITNPKYKERVRKLKSMWIDTLITPEDNALFRLEKIMHHRTRNFMSYTRTKCVGLFVHVHFILICSILLLGFLV